MQSFQRPQAKLQDKPLYSIIIIWEARRKHEP